MNIVEYMQLQKMMFFVLIALAAASLGGAYLLFKAAYRAGFRQALERWELDGGENPFETE